MKNKINILYVINNAITAKNNPLKDITNIFIIYINIIIAINSKNHILIAKFLNFKFSKINPCSKPDERQNIDVIYDKQCNDSKKCAKWSTLFNRFVV